MRFYTLLVAALIVACAQSAVVAPSTCSVSTADTVGCIGTGDTASVHSDGTCVCFGNCTVVPQGTCQPSGSLGLLIQGQNVVAFVPKGSWEGGSTGIAVVNVQGSLTTNKNIATGSVVNSCSANPLTGMAVCTANDNHVYILTTSGITNTLTSSGSGSIGFSGGSCTNCGVSIDAMNNRALISLAVGSNPSFQFLDLTTLVFAAPFSAQGGISEDPLVDPIRSLLLSPTEDNNFQIVDIKTPTSPKLYNFGVSIGGELDSAAEDCATGIAFAGAEFSTPSQIFLVDLSQVTYTPGSPTGSWSSPATNVQTLSESNLSAGPCGLAVAQGTFTGIISGEFGGNQITAVAMPRTSGTGIPAFPDWVSCGIPGFDDGLDPHTLSAYMNPSNGDAMAVLANQGGSQLAVVDLTLMLAVSRTSGGHGCSSGNLASPSIASFITVP